MARSCSQGQCLEEIMLSVQIENIGDITPVQITIVEKLLSAAARHGDIV